MDPPTPVFIICSSRQRTGKTLLARAFTEFFVSEERPVAAFDVNPNDFALSDYLPAFTAIAALDDTRGEVALFDQLIAADGVPKIIDLGVLMFDRFFNVLHAIDFVREASRYAVAPMALFVADADARSMQGYAVLRARFPELPLVPVFNEGLPGAACTDEAFPPTNLGGAPVTIPRLAPVLKAIIERPGFSFATYGASATDKTSELYGWTQRLFLQCRDLELRLLLTKLRPQGMRHSA